MWNIGKFPESDDENHWKMKDLEEKVKMKFSEEERETFEVYEGWPKVSSQVAQERLP